jgi:DNA-binding CsgD family transcriptional regulator
MSAQPQGSDAMRFRFATAADFSTCHAMIDRGMVTSRKVHSRIPQLWNDLRAINPGSVTLIEDPELAHPRGIEAFGVCAFVDDAFVCELVATPRPYLSATIYERMLRGESPLLTAAAIRAANSGAGLNLVCLHFCLRNRDLEHPRTRDVLQVSNASFFFFFAGYRINALYQEVYGSQHAAYLNAGGLRQIADFGAVAGKGATADDAERPFLFGLRKEEIAPAAVNPLSLLFHALPPRFAFSASAQHVLERALLLHSDEEIAAQLKISVDAVKKTWRAIYQRVDNVAPRMFGMVARASNPSHRSAERRRHLLEYLRTHLEELRPVDGRRGVGAAATDRGNVSGR